MATRPTPASIIVRLVNDPQTAPNWCMPFKKPSGGELPDWTREIVEFCLSRRQAKVSLDQGALSGPVQEWPGTDDEVCIGQSVHGAPNVAPACGIERPVFRSRAGYGQEATENAFDQFIKVLSEAISN